MSSFVPTPAERGIGIALLSGAGAFVLLCAAVLGVAARRHSPVDAPRGAAASFASGGKTIPVERFQPAKPGRYPAILFIHGADGLQVPAWHARYRHECQPLA